MIQVIFLVRGAIFRSRETPRDQKRLSLDICSLGELIDMYHTYKATILHDKLYALLGMCSDDLKTAGLEPNYDLEWRELMRRLVKFVLGGQVSVDTWEDKEIAFIKSRGRILGKVSRVESNMELGRQRVKVIFKNSTKQPGSIIDDSALWTLPKSAISVREEDIICIFQGTSKPTIIRLRDDHFVIIIIAVVPSERTEIDINIQPEISQSVSVARDFPLVWNWEFTSGDKLDQKEYDNLIQTSNWGSPQTGLASQIKNVIRIWSVAQILEDIEEDEKAREMLHKAVKSYETALGEKQSHIPEIQNGVTLLSWAARKGCEDIIGLLLTTGTADAYSKDRQGRTPLSWAAMNGHEAVVKLLLTMGRVDVDSKEMEYGQTPLSWAANNGHEAIFKLLLTTGTANADSIDMDGRTPLSLAAENGHEVIVKLLLTTGTADAVSKDRYGRAPLSWAAANGHEAIVKLLLTAGTVNAESEDTQNGQTALSWAAKNGHKAVVKLLQSFSSV
jgi:hypothetical protein